MASSKPSKPEYGCLVEDIIKIELNDEEMSFKKKITLRRDKKSKMKGDVFILQVDGDYIKSEVEVTHATIMKQDEYGNTSIRYSCKKPVYSISKLSAIIHYLLEKQLINENTVVKLSNDPSLSSFGIFYPGAKYIPYNTPNNKIDKNMREYYNIQSVKFADAYADSKFSVRDIAQKGPYKISLNIKNICIGINRNKNTGESFTELKFTWYFGCIILFKPERLSLHTTDLNGNPISVGPVLDDDEDDEEEEDKEYKKEKKEKKENNKKETSSNNSTRRSKVPVIPEDVSLTSKYNNRTNYDEDDEPIVVKKEVKPKKVIISDEEEEEVKPKKVIISDEEEEEVKPKKVIISNKKATNSKVVTKEVKPKKVIISKNSDNSDDDSNNDSDDDSNNVNNTQVKSLVTKKEVRVKKEDKPKEEVRGKKEVKPKEEVRGKKEDKPTRGKKVIVSDDSDY
jgi:hypothetical protein